MATHFVGRNGTVSSFCATVEGGGYAEFERDGAAWVYVANEGLTDEQERVLEGFSDEALNLLHAEAMRNSAVRRPLSHRDIENHASPLNPSGRL